MLPTIATHKRHGEALESLAKYAGSDTTGEASSDTTISNSAREIAAILAQHASLSAIEMGEQVRARILEAGGQAVSEKDSIEMLRQILDAHSSCTAEQLKQMLAGFFSALGDQATAILPVVMQRSLNYSLEQFSGIVHGVVIARGQTTINELDCKAIINAVLSMDTVRRAETDRARYMPHLLGEFTAALGGSAIAPVHLKTIVTELVKRSGLHNGIEQDAMGHIVQQSGKGAITDKNLTTIFGALLACQPADLFYAAACVLSNFWDTAKLHQTERLLTCIFADEHNFSIGQLKSIFSGLFESLEEQDSDFFERTIASLLATIGAAHDSYTEQQLNAMVAEIFWGIHVAELSPFLESRAEFHEQARRALLTLIQSAAPTCSQKKLVAMVLGASKIFEADEIFDAICSAKVPPLKKGLFFAELVALGKMSRQSHGQILTSSLEKLEEQDRDSTETLRNYIEAGLLAGEKDMGKIALARGLDDTIKLKFIASIIERGSLTREEGTSKFVSILELKLQPIFKVRMLTLLLGKGFGNDELFKTVRQLHIGSLGEIGEGIEEFNRITWHDAFHGLYLSYCGRMSEECIQDEIRLIDKHIHLEKSTRDIIRDLLTQTLAAKTSAREALLRQADAAPLPLDII